MSEFKPEQVDRWDCQAGQFLDGGTVAVMVGATDGEYVYAWQYEKLLALWSDLELFCTCTLDRQTTIQLREFQRLQAESRNNLAQKVPEALSNSSQVVE
jgi:hypothetical protein